MNKGIGSLLCCLIVLVISCQPKESPDITSVEDSSNPEVQSEIQSLSMEIAYLEGWVNLIREDQVMEAEIGQAIYQGDILEVEAQSFCELQIAQISRVFIEENSRLNISQSLVTPQGGNQSTLELAQGTVLCKVQKLAQSDRFQVATDSAVCGVRGTEFLVSKEIESGNVQLAVLEGSVQLTPPESNWEEIRQVGESASQDIQEKIELLEASFPIIEPGEEILLSDEDFLEVQPQMAALTQWAEEIAAASDEDQILQLEEHAEALLDTAIQQIPQVEELSEEKIQTIEEQTIEKVEVLNQLAKEVSFTVEIPTESIDNQSQEELAPVDLVAVEEMDEQVQAVPHLEVLQVALSEVPMVGKPVQMDQRFYALNQNGKVYAFNAQGILWQRDSGNNNQELGHPILSSKGILQSGKQTTLLLDSSTGQELRRISGSMAPLLLGQTPLPWDNYVFYPLIDGIMRLDGYKLSVDVKVDIPMNSNMSPSMFGDTMLMADTNGTLHFIDPVNMVIKNSLPTDAVQPVALSVAQWQNYGVFSGRQGNVVCIDLANQSLLWSGSLEKGPVYHDGAVGAEGAFFLGGNSITGFDWQGNQTFVLTGAATPACYHGGMIYWGDDQGFLRVHSASDGREIKRYDLNGSIQGRPLVYGSSEILIMVDGRAVFIRNL